MFAFAVILPAGAPPAWCGSQAPDGSGEQSILNAPDSANPVSPSARGHALRAALHEFSPARLLEEKIFRRAETAFPSFCKDWESKLRDRERNNLQHISWQGRGGTEAGTYVGYGSVRSCTCKQTAKGIPIGKLSYQEFQYELDGKTVDEARHATPKPAAITNTTEIFRYDKKKGKWIY